MIVDAHYHLDPRMESVERVLAQMDFHGIERTALIATMVAPFRVGGVASRAVGLMRRALRGRGSGLGRLLYRTTVTRGGKFSLLGKTYPILERPDNETVARAMEAHPGRFHGWIFVNPLAADPLEEAGRYLEKPGWIGVKCHPFWHRYPVRALAPVAALCQERGKPMLIHLGGDRERGDFACLPRQFPRLRIVYAHAGVPWFRELWGFVREREPLQVDLSSPYLDGALRAAVVREIGAERCLYGTDGPYGYEGSDGLYDRGVILGEIARLPLSSPDRERILGGNCAALLQT